MERDLLPERERVWPPPYWVLLFALALLVSLLIDALVAGEQGEWFGGVFFGVAVMVMLTKPGPSEHSDEQGRQQ